MKRNYVKPSMREVLMRQRYHLLSGSDPTINKVTSNASGLEFGGAAPTTGEVIVRSREDDWDDWEDEDE